MIRTYSELLTFSTYEDRLKYLQLNGNVGEVTYGGSRWVNQVLYHSPEWKRFKDRMIIRDRGCDLALDGYEIFNNQPVYLHHINPINYSDIVTRNPSVFDPENVVCVTFDTHQKIHYPNRGISMPSVITRKPGDTTLW